MKPTTPLLLLAFLLTACEGEIAPGTRTAEHPLLSRVRTAPVTETALAGTDAYVASIESRDRALITSRTDGWVAQVTIREGETVQAGQLLVVIRDNQAADQVRQAEAAANEARQSLASARSRLDLAQKTEKRYQQLFRNQAVTPQEMDQIVAELQLARQAVQAAEAGLARSESAQDAARTAAAWSRVSAPYAARVVRRQVEEGSTVLPGTPLLLLDRTDGWTARAEIPETRAGQIRLGEPVRIEVPAAGRSFATRVSDILPAADPRSRTVQVKAPLPAEAELTSGLFARMIFPGRAQETLLVPSAAVVRRGQLTGVFLVQEGLLHYRLVKTGRQVEDLIEILSGLEAGDVVVVEGVERARSGARVEG